MIIVLACWAAAVFRYGWFTGLIVGWTLGPFLGAAGALVCFLWLLPLQSPALRLHRRSAARRERGLAAAPELAITAIVPVYNGEDYLRRSLPPLAAMLRAGELCEIIVVDDSSTDASAQVATEMGARVVPSGGRLGPGQARNMAASLARGEVLWFVDADVVVHPGGPERIRRSFANDEVVAVFGSYDDEPPEQNFASRYKNLVHHHYHQKSRGQASTFWSGCGAVRASAFAEAEGFDGVLFGNPSIEDIELGYRLRDRGGLIVADPDLLSTHLKHWSVRELVYTDIVRRALPWARLMMERGRVLNDLNVAESERLRAALAIATIASAPAALAGFVPGWTAPLLAGTALTTNWELFQTFRRRRGAAFALAAIAFHQLYYVYSTGAFVACWTAAKLKPPRPSPAA